MLGVLLFFDSALLALGNVRLTLLQLQPQSYDLTEPHLHFIDSVLVRPDTHHRHAKDVLLLRSETENSRDAVFPRRHLARIPQMAVCWVRRGDIWVLKLVWVGEHDGFCLQNSSRTHCTGTSSR